jgi:hypothetical protein
VLLVGGHHRLFGVGEILAGRQPATPAYWLTSASSGSPGLRKLVEPHRRPLEANLGLAFFGL